MNELKNAFGWEVSTAKLQTEAGLFAPGYKAIVRSDSNTILHVSKKNYTPTPNARLTDMVERLSATTGYDIAGYSEFKGGRLVLGYLKSKPGTQICGFETKEYMVVGNSHDGTTSTFVGSVSDMLRCQNQFGQIHQSLKAYHTTNNDARIENILGMFEEYQQEKELISRKMEEFRKVKIDKKIIHALTERLFAIENGLVEKLDDLSTRKKNMVETFNVSIDRETADLGTNLFGLFNAVTHYTTHEQRAQEKVLGNILGKSGDLNKKAFQFCNELITA